MDLIATTTSVYTSPSISRKQLYELIPHFALVMLFQFHRCCFEQRQTNQMKARKLKEQ